jgi:O-antigen biosynthesis protein
MFEANRWFPPELRLPRVTTEDLLENKRITSEMQRSEVGAPRSAIWFFPHFTHPLKGGLRTAFCISERMSKEWGTNNFFVIDNYFNKHVSSDLKCQMKNFFPELKFELLNLRYEDNLSDVLPSADVGFATLWTTAYTLARYNKCFAKFYLTQDYEPLFYPAGSISAVIEQTYRLGFAFLANTPGVAKRVADHSAFGMYFVPGVEKSVFYPERRKVKTEGPYRIVFYGRPKNERNCFMLGIEALRMIKSRLKGQVEIISVGFDYPPGRYDLQGVLKVPGLLKSMEEVSSIYRSSDLGISFMTTPHPSYQPLEYMACGCPALTNINNDNDWLYKDKRNIFLTEPLIINIAERVIEVLGNSKLREKVIEGGLETVSKLDWETTYKAILKYIKSPEPYNPVEINI